MNLKNNLKIYVAIVTLVLAMFLPHGSSAQTAEDKTPVNIVGPSRLTPKYKYHKGKVETQLIPFEIEGGLKSVFLPVVKKSGKVSKTKGINFLFYDYDPDLILSNNANGANTIIIYGRKITRTEKRVLMDEYGKKTIRRLKHDKYLMATGYSVKSNVSVQSNSTGNGNIIQEENIQQR